MKARPVEVDLNSRQQILAGFWALKGWSINSNEKDSSGVQNQRQEEGK